MTSPTLLLGVLLAVSAPTSPEDRAAGRLAPCPSSPNCVSSQADDAGHRVEAFAFQGEPGAALARLRQVIEAMPRTRIVTSQPGYLHAEFTSRLFRFVDDVELLVDAGAGVVHVRSASRVGYGDLGANRKRVEEIRRAFAETGREP